MKTKTGYHLGDGIEFLKNLPTESVDGIFTDPPWGGRAKIIGNDDPGKLIKAVSDIGETILKPNGIMCFWVRSAGNHLVFKNVGDLFEHRYTMVIKYVPMRFFANFMSEYDFIYLFQKKGARWPKQKNGKTKITQTFVKVSTGKRDTRHPCGRPIEAVKWALSQLFDKNDFVVDPFGGSDTFGVSCRELEIPYASFEIDPAMYKHGLARNGQILIGE